MTKASKIKDQLESEILELNLNLSNLLCKNEILHKMLQLCGFNSDTIGKCYQIPIAYLDNEIEYVKNTKEYIQHPLIAKMFFDNYRIYESLTDCDNQTLKTFKTICELDSESVLIQDLYKLNPHLLELFSQIEDSPSIINTNKFKLNAAYKIQDYRLWKANKNQKLNSMTSDEILNNPNMKDLMEKLNLEVTGEVVGGNKIAVVDIETTGFLKPGGSIVEIGIVELDLDTGDTKILFDSLVREPILTAKHRSKPFGWIFENSDLTPEMVRAAPNAEDVFPLAQYILNQYPLGCTAFNKRFDFDFLRDRGFTITELQCPMLLLTPIMELPKKNGYGGNKWPNVEEAWNYFFPNDPYDEKHRGADDAVHEAKIVYELYKAGDFNI